MHATRILIIGSGYVGLVSGACFAEMGNKVICLDIDEEKIASLASGKIPFYEPGLEELVHKNIREKRLSFTTSYAEGISRSNVIFIALPTPSNPDGSADISYLLSAGQEIAKHLSEYCLIVNKSTAPVGTVEKIKETIRETLRKLDKYCEFDVASNPEFLKEGGAIQDCLKPDRIIFGTERSKASKILRKIYSGFSLSKEKILEMDIRSAELTKYAANAMLACRISFMNEIAAICETYDVNIHNVRKGIGTDSRIGHQFLYAGGGFGGSCFPKDLRAIINMAENSTTKAPLLQAIYAVNQQQKTLMGEKILDYFSKHGGIQDKTLAIWGLAFKPNTDDIREAPSLVLIDMLVSRGANLRLYDPMAMANVQNYLAPSKQITFCENEREAAKNADGICLVTEWKQFRFVDMQEILTSMKGNGFFDARNQYCHHEMREIGFHYFGIGIPRSKTPLVETILQKYACR